MNSCSKTFALLPQNLGTDCPVAALSTASLGSVGLTAGVHGTAIVWFSIIVGFFFLVLMSMGVNLMIGQDFRIQLQLDFTDMY